MSNLIKDSCKLMGMHKVTTTVYHLQTDGLVEQFNQTLTDVLAKTVDKSGRDWDRHLPHMPIAYQVSPQESTQEYPFFLLHRNHPDTADTADTAENPISSGP